MEQRALPPLYRGWHGKEGDKIWSGIQSRPADSRVRDTRLNTSIKYVNRGLRESLRVSDKGRNEQILN